MNPKSSWFNEILAALILALLGVAWLVSLNHLSQAPLSWMVLRSTGIAAYLALAVATAFGALLSSQYAPALLNRAAQYGWHGILSGFALVASTVHGLFILVDKEYPQTLAGLLVPGFSTLKPLEVGFGTLAVYGLALVYFSTVAKKRIAPSTWKVLHFAAYPAFVLSTLHGIGTGSDALAPLYWAASVSVLFTFILRLSEEISRRGRLEAVRGK